MDEIKKTYIDYEKVQSCLKQAVKGQFFAVKFIKKDGSERTMLFKLNPKTWGGEKTTNGIGMSWNPLEKGFLVVLDINKNAWRCVNINTIESLGISGKTLTLEQLMEG